MLEIIILATTVLSLIISTLCLRTAATDDGYIFPLLCAVMGGVLTFYAGYGFSILTADSLLQFIFLFWLD